MKRPLEPGDGLWALRSPREPRFDERSEGRWEAEIGTVRVLFGEGRLREAGKVIAEMGCSRALLVSDAGVRAAGHVDRAEKALAAGGVEARVFDQVSENPTSRQVEAGVDFARPERPECLVALGGGSVMDCAKGINFLLTNGGQMSDYWGFGRANKPMLPAVGIPTTAGTGSEAQSFALISDSDSHRKMACGDPKARFRAVILDPGLTASVPREVAAASGLDALAHAVESYVTTRGNPVSRLLARRAWELLESHLQTSWERPSDIEVRAEVLLAAHLAGAAIEQSMLGAAHACANPLTSAFGLAHGLAVAMMLPHVVRYNAPAVEDAYRQLADAAGIVPNGHPSDRLAHRIEVLRSAAGLPGRLRDLSISRSELPILAEAASLEWTARFNPRPVSQAELLSIYESAF